VLRVQPLQSSCHELLPSKSNTLVSDPYLYADAPTSLHAESPMIQYPDSW
jgi:hypothetical protein